MRRIPKLLRAELEKRMEKWPVRVSTTELHEGDIIEFVDLQHAHRYGRVQSIRPRVKRIVLVSLKREDFPRGFKELAKLVKWKSEIAEKQAWAIYRRKNNGSPANGRRGDE